MLNIEETFATHFDDKFGSQYWLDLKNKLPFDPCKEIKTREDLHLLGNMKVEAMRRRPLKHFIPKRFHLDLANMVLSETGGTTGDPCRRVFFPEEFDQAFLGPWQRAAKKRNFPIQATWLFIGPSGPHIIGQAARAMSRKVGSLECFSVDCDVRWFKKQDPGSLGATLYLDHVLDQAMNIINHQEIEVLFTTPPLLDGLTERMDKNQRQKIRGIHLGGIKLDADTYQRINKQDFPGAIVLPGYGNSLFGVAFEDYEAAPGAAPTYLVDDPALWLQIIPFSKENTSGLSTTLTPGERGRIVLHRLDKSFMIVNMLERDTAIYTDLKQNRLTEIEPLKEVSAKKKGLY